MTESNPFAQPTRQSGYAIIFILGNVFRMLIRQLWIVILIILFNPKKRAFSGFTLFLLALAVFGAFSSILNYFSYFFYIRDGELVMEKGIFRKIKLNIPLDRIQTVNFKQGLLHQAFNVVAVEIDTAGSSGQEFSLQAIRKEDADTLRNYVEDFKRSMPAANGRIEQPGEEAETAVAGDQIFPKLQKEKAESLLFRLSSFDLLKIGVSQNHLRTAGIIMAFFLGFFDDLEEAFDFDLSKKIEEMLGLAQHDSTFQYYLLLGIPFFLFVSFFITLFNTVLRYFDLRFWRTERGFKMISGLFTRQEVSANLQKIQYLRWSSSPLMRLFGMQAVRLPQAASVTVSRKMAVSVPGCYEQHLAPIRSAYFPEETTLEFEEHGVNARIIRRQVLLQGVLPVALLMVFSYSWLGTSVWVWALWLPVAFWQAVRYHRSWHWFISEEGLRKVHGVVTRRTVLLQWYKVQAVSIRQRFFLRRVGLAQLVLYTAAGAVSIPYIPLEKARAVQNFVLYKIETDSREWM